MEVCSELFFYFIFIYLYLWNYRWRGMRVLHQGAVVEAAAEAGAQEGTEGVLVFIFMHLFYVFFKFLFFEINSFTFYGIHI